MIVGQRVLLKKFGWGTILGFEAILKINDVVASRAIETGRPDDRILVQLDDPTLWCLASESQPHPWMLHSDVLDSFKCRACAWRGNTAGDECPNCSSVLIEEIEP
jgi:hypothetical protein